MDASPTQRFLSLTRALREADLPFMVVGAWAVMVHGFPRFSKDIDVVVHLPFDENERVRPLLAPLGLKDVVERKDEWGHRFVADYDDGLRVEVFFTPPHPWYDEEYERRVLHEIQGQPIPFLSPENLVLRKLVNCRLRRAQDFDDAIGVIATQGETLDVQYLRAQCGIHRVCGLLAQALSEARELEPRGER